MKKYIISIIIVFIFFMGSFAQELTIDSCKTYALENNKKLKKAQMQLEISGQVKKTAFTNYFPTVSAGAMAMKANDYLVEAEIPEMNLPVYDGNPANLQSPTLFTYFPGMELQLLDYTNAGFITAVQPLYAGGRIRNGNKLAKLGVEFSQLNLNLTTEQILVATEEYFWKIASLEEKLKTIHEYEILLNSLLNDVQVSFDAGLIQKSDVLKVQLELNKINASKLKLENGIKMLKMVLAQHIGKEYSEQFQITYQLTEIPAPFEVYEEVATALQNRQEYKMLNKAVEAEKIHKKIAVGEYKPQLAIGVQGFYLDMADNQTSKGLAFATLSIPISKWWEGSHKIQEHNIQINLAKNDLQEKSELITLQINKTYMELQEYYEQIKVAEVSEEQATEHFKVTKDNYDAGIINTSELLEAQAIYQQSLDALVDAKTSYKIKLAYYLHATAKNI